MSGLQELESLREKFDCLDKKLFDPLFERAALTAQVGEIKKKINKEIFEREREIIIFKKLQKKCNKQNVDFNYVQNIWNIILNNSHEMQIEGIKRKD